MEKFVIRSPHDSAGEPAAHANSTPTRKRFPMSYSILDGLHEFVEIDEFVSAEYAGLPTTTTMMPLPGTTTLSPNIWFN